MLQINNYYSLDGNTMCFQYDKYIKDRCQELQTNYLSKNPLHKITRNISQTIFDILCSNRNSVYAYQMNRITLTQMQTYITQCVKYEKPIQIVLAGMPGKCANRNKVSYSTPDLGEFEILVRLHSLNTLVKTFYSPGLTFTFISDYKGLSYTFFPEYDLIDDYVEKVRKWTILYCMNEIKIMFSEDVNPVITHFKNLFVDSLVDHTLIPPDADLKLCRSIRANCNFRKCNLFYQEFFSNKLTEEETLALAQTYYSYFWEFWNQSQSVPKYFGKVIYASPVAYHPETRLCLRLQVSSARTTAWNGVAFCSGTNIYSLEQSSCIANGYTLYYSNDGMPLCYMKNAN